MALIQCVECGKNISDKAASCPGCGCPMQHQNPQISYKGLTKDELWLKAYNLHYKGRPSDIPVAAEIYTFIIDTYPDTEQSGYAKTQLEVLQNKHQIDVIKIRQAECECGGNRRIDEITCDSPQIHENERVILRIDGVRSWDKDSPGINIGTFLGTFVLTNYRILFLSSGDSGIFSVGTLLGGAIGGPGLASVINMVGSKVKTKDLDVQDLFRNGGFQIILNDVITCEVNRRFDLTSYLSMVHKDQHGMKGSKCFKADSGMSKGKWEEARAYIKGAI